jgi:hypothetical protein
VLATLLLRRNPTLENVEDLVRLPANTYTTTREGKEQQGVVGFREGEGEGWKMEGWRVRSVAPTQMGGRRGLFKGPADAINTN